MRKLTLPNGYCVRFRHTMLKPVTLFQKCHKVIFCRVHNALSIYLMWDLAYKLTHHNFVIARLNKVMKKD